MTRRRFTKERTDKTRKKTRSQSKKVEIEEEDIKVIEAEEEEHMEIDNSKDLNTIKKRKARRIMNLKREDKEITKKRIWTKTPTIISTIMAQDQSKRK